MYEKNSNTTWQIVINATSGEPGPPGPDGQVGGTGAVGPAGLTLGGNWTASVTYPQGALVFYNGSLYISTVNNNLDNVPYTNASVDPYWYRLQTNTTGTKGNPGQIGDTGGPGPAGYPLVYLYAWNLTTNYTQNSLVTYNGMLYLSTNQSLGIVPNSSAATGIWYPQTMLEPGPDGYPGPPGVSIPGPAGSPAVAPTISTSWNANTTYQYSDIVYYNQSFFISIVANNTGVPPAGAGTNSTTNWSLLPINITGPPGGPGSTGLVGLVGNSGNAGVANNGSYSPTSTYINGDFVTYNNQLWVSNTNNNLGNAPNGSSGEWTQIFANVTGPAGMQGPPGGGILDAGIWNATRPYSYGNMVVYNNNFYFSNYSGVNLANQPGNSSAIYWQQIISGASLVGPIGAPGASLPGPIGNNGTVGATGPPGSPWVYTFAYNSTYNYTANELVTYLGSLYLTNATAGNIGNYPNASSPYWTLLQTNTTGPPGGTGPVGPQGPNAPSVLWNPYPITGFGVFCTNTTNIALSGTQIQTNVTCTKAMTPITSNPLWTAAPSNMIGIASASTSFGTFSMISYNFGVTLTAAPSSTVSIGFTASPGSPLPPYSQTYVISFDATNYNIPINLSIPLNFVTLTSSSAASVALTNLVMTTPVYAGSATSVSVTQATVSAYSNVPVS